MKKIILIIGILIGLTIGVSAEVREDTTRKVSSKRDIKKNFETSFTNELVKYIETGDVTPLLDLVQEDDITFLGLLPETYKKSENKEYFAQFIKKYLNVRSTDLTILRIDKEYYDNYYHPLGLTYRMTILYPNSKRYDSVEIDYSHSGKVRGITINDNLHVNTYIDGDLNKIYGSQYGYEGVSGTLHK
tara:strand:- start:503 stop:1066 length:564 start_codon:yes stop_codon:yes gene_type:complete